MGQRYSTILVPYDDSEFSKKAVNEAIKLSKKLEAKIDLLMAVTTSVTQPPAIAISGTIKGKGASKAMDEYAEKATEEAKNIMQQNVEYCKNNGVNASFSVVTDNPSKAIIDYANKRESDIIVMGSQGLRGIKKIKILGSVSRHVLENAPCPVMIVH